ncbi:hypothetical protein D8674_005780 [Pyrus ussuriensis x Pyrus communis]|uniref:Uncharacterized protein n=1 Tax=Pyrus ussuriensis x Pyrus communis TaxID=2448454 RepID=A0A5N5FSQ8_9ROSA|nr:hypothetical protein D8674_005780 [Pyrus ussuriensis x Pyrus communis]
MDQHNFGELLSTTPPTTITIDYPFAIDFSLHATSNPICVPPPRARIACNYTGRNPNIYYETGRSILPGQQQQRSPSQHEEGKVPVAKGRPREVISHGQHSQRGVLIGRQTVKMKS